MLHHTYNKLIKRRIKLHNNKHFKTNFLKQRPQNWRSTSQSARRDQIDLPSTSNAHRRSIYLIREREKSRVERETHKSTMYGFNPGKNQILLIKEMIGM